MRRLGGPRNRHGRAGTRGIAKGRWRPARTTIVRVACAVAAVAGVSLAWPRLGPALRQHPYFALREVVIGQHRRLTPEAIRAAAGIVPGMSVWDVDPRAIEARLLAEPWVRSARVRRQLPHRVVLAVREHRPVAIVATADGDHALYYVAAHGRLFASVGPGDARDFPYITGIATADLSAAGYAAHAIRRALLLVRAAARAGDGLGAVSEIHVDRARGLTLLPTRPAVPVELGWDGFDTKLQHLPAVLALWAGREAEIAAVSCLFDDDVIVRTRPQPPAARAPRRAART